MKNILFSTLILAILLESVKGQLYGLLLNNPLRDLNMNSALSPRNLNQHQARRQFYATGSDSGEELHAESSDSETSTRVNSGEQNLMTETVLIRCRRDADCIDDNSPDADNLMYCDRHYGYCDFFRSAGELCRTDSQCDAGLICMFGRCEAPQVAGASGARCSAPADCNPGLCCARQHGERICKPKLKLGQQCFVPLGGLHYSLNELCPCEEGLACTQQHKR